jgi:hypothetical protein
MARRTYDFSTIQAIRAALKKKKKPVRHGLSTKEAVAALGDVIEDKW